MKISELREKLNYFEKLYGDIECVTPGFDEYGYEKVETLEILSLSKRDFSKKELKLHDYLNGLPEYSDSTNTGKFFPDEEEVLNLNF